MGTIPEEVSVIEFKSQFLKRSNTSLILDELGYGNNIKFYSNDKDNTFYKGKCNICGIKLNSSKYIQLYRAYDSFVCKNCFIKISNKI